MSEVLLAGIGVGFASLAGLAFTVIAVSRWGPRSPRSGEASSRQGRKD